MEFNLDTLTVIHNSLSPAVIKFPCVRECLYLGAVIQPPKDDLVSERTFIPYLFQFLADNVRCESAHGMATERPEFGPGGTPRAGSTPGEDRRSLSNAFGANRLPTIASDSGRGLSECRAR